MGGHPGKKHLDFGAFCHGSLGDANDMPHILGRCYKNPDTFCHVIPPLKKN
jgi:hypothetical protein